MPNRPVPYALGTRGPDVQLLHQGLRELGYHIPAHELTEQAFGEGTAEALRGFQARMGLGASGAIDEATAAALRRAVESEELPLESRGGSCSRAERPPARWSCGSTSTAWDR